MSKEKYDNGLVVADKFLSNLAISEFIKKFEVNDFVGFLPALAIPACGAAKEFAARLVRGNFNAISDFLPDSEVFLMRKQQSRRLNPKP